jgi:chromosome segregation ATPase
MMARAGYRARNELRERAGEHEDKINHLVDLQIKNEEKFARNEERFAKLAQSQTDTDRRLNALIDIIKEGRNGDPPSSN